MRILHCVESYHPALGGMLEVVKQLSERLVRRGHDVTVVTRKIPERKSNFVNGVKIVEFDIGDNFVNGVWGDRKGYEEFLLNSDFDIVTFFAAQQWATDVALPILDRIKGKKVSVPTGYSGFYWPAYQDYFAKMKTWIHGYDMNVYLSNDYRDINFARENGVTKFCLIPNGAAEDEFTPQSAINVRTELGFPTDCFLLLHVGSYTGWKGHLEAMEIFLRARLRNARLLMIGNHSDHFRISKIRNFPLYILYSLDRLSGKNRIVFKGFDRKFTVAAYQQADLFLFPSNIECSPIVLFECAAAKLPFMATDAGNSQEISEWTQGGVIMPTVKNAEGFSFAKIKESVKVIRNLYKDKQLQKEMGTKAYHNWKEKYSWEKIALQYEKLYLDLLNN